VEVGEEDDAGTRMWRANRKEVSRFFLDGELGKYREIEKGRRRAPPG